MEGRNGRDHFVVRHEVSPDVAFLELPASSRRHRTAALHCTVGPISLSEWFVSYPSFFFHPPPSSGRKKQQARSGLIMRVMLGTAVGVLLGIQACDGESPTAAVTSSILPCSSRTTVGSARGGFYVQVRKGGGGWPLAHAGGGCQIFDQAQASFTFWTFLISSQMKLQKKCRKMHEMAKRTLSHVC